MSASIRRFALLSRKLHNSAHNPQPSLTQLIKQESSSIITPQTTVLRPLSTFSKSTDRRPRSLYTRKHHEKRIVPFNQHELYSVVANVDEYQQFVPWCTHSVVTQRVNDQQLIAELAVGFRFLSERYSSVITLDPYSSVSADVPNSSLFEYLVTDWAFERATDPQYTNLSFSVEFAFRNPLYQRVTDLFFDEVVKQMVGAFETRCHVKFPSAQHTTNTLHRW